MIFEESLHCVAFSALFSCYYAAYYTTPWTLVPSVNFYVKNMLYNNTLAISANVLTAVDIHRLSFAVLSKIDWLHKEQLDKLLQSVVTGMCLFQYSNLYSQEFISIILVICAFQANYAHNCSSSVEPSAKDMLASALLSEFCTVRY